MLAAWSVATVFTRDNPLISIRELIDTEQVDRFPLVLISQSKLIDVLNKIIKKQLGIEYDNSHVSYFRLEANVSFSLGSSIRPRFISPVATRSIPRPGRHQNSKPTLAGKLLVPGLV